MFFGNFQDTFCWRRTKNNKLKGDKNIKVWPLNSNQTFNQTIAALNANMTNAPAETTNTALNRRRQDAIRIAKNNHILLITILYCDLDNIFTWFLLCFPTRTTCFYWQIYSMDVIVLSLLVSFKQGRHGARLNAN